MSKEGIGAFLNPAQMSKLNRLALNSRYVVEGTLAGRHRSAQKGASTEFADHRSYMPGDDLKRIDWKVLGRTDKYYVRRYQDETNLVSVLGALGCPRRAEALLQPVARRLADDSPWKATIEATLRELGALTGMDELSCDAMPSP